MTASQHPGEGREDGWEEPLDDADARIRAAEPPPHATDEFKAGWHKAVSASLTAVARARYNARLAAARGEPPTSIEDQLTVLHGFSAEPTPELRPASRWISESVAGAIIKGTHPALAARGEPGLDVERLEQAIHVATNAHGWGIYDASKVWVGRPHVARVIAAEYDRLGSE